MAWSRHLEAAADLITTHADRRDGFIAMALEKNRRATAHVADARALAVLAGQCAQPSDLLDIPAILPALLLASGLSDKSLKHLNEADKTAACDGLIERHLEPAGADFVSELVYRFLLTRGDSLGGTMRNVAGVIAERRFLTALVDALTLRALRFSFLDRDTGQWIVAPNMVDDIPARARGIGWSRADEQPRTLVFNLTVPLVRKNIDLCLFDAGHRDYDPQSDHSCHRHPERFLALGELKGGIDPAGADEHWKTADTALRRIRSAFGERGLTPDTFFVGAAIERTMADEIFAQLENGALSNAANLCRDDQVASLCAWLIDR